MSSSDDCATVSERRWLESEGESSVRSSTCSYSDVTRTPPQSVAPAAPTPPAPGPAAAITRLPAFARLGPARKCTGSLAVSSWMRTTSNSDVEPTSTGPSRRRVEPQRRCSPSPEEVGGLCFCWLDNGHPVHECTNDIRCRRCLVSSHSSRECDPRRRGSAH